MVKEGDTCLIPNPYSDNYVEVYVRSSGRDSTGIFFKCEHICGKYAGAIYEDHLTLHVEAPAVPEPRPIRAVRRSKNAFDWCWFWMIVDRRLLKLVPREEQDEEVEEDATVAAAILPDDIES